MLTPLRHSIFTALLCTIVGVTAHAQPSQRLTRTQIVNGDTVLQQIDSNLTIDPQTLESLLNGALSSGAITSLVMTGDDGDTLEHIENGDTLIHREDAQGLLQQFFGGGGRFRARGGSGTVTGYPTLPIDRSRITLTPSVSTVSAQSHTATFHVTNPSNDSIPLDFIVQYANPHAIPLITRERSRGATDAKWSLARWISDVPSGLVLAPHETRTVTMHIAVPANATAGKYSAYVVVYYEKPVTINESTDLSGGGLDFLSDTTAHGFPRNSYVLGQLVYVKKP